MEMRFRQFKFFSYIRAQFGTNAVELMKEFIKLTNQSIMLRVRIRFLRSCNTYKLIPPHLEKYKNYGNNLSFFHDSSKKRLKLLIQEHVRTVLRLELDDAYRQLTKNRSMFFKIHNKILKLLPWYVANRFFVYHENNGNTKWTIEVNRVKKKIEWLIEKKNENMKKDIKSIKYYYTEKNRNELKISKDKDAGLSSVIDVESDYFELEKPLNELHKNWFVNLSNKIIPEEVQLLLQLGEKFSLPMVEKDKERTIVEFIKYIEKNIFKEVDDISNQIRNQSIPIIKRISKKPNDLEKTKKLILRLLKQTKQFAIENPDVLFTKADKGNATVAINLLEYNNKMTKIFSDSNTYTIVKRDPIKKFSN